MIRDWGYDELNGPEDVMKVRCPRCDTCGFEEDENYEHSTCSVCLGMGYLIQPYLPNLAVEEDEKEIKDG